ncbi:MAG: hypothetical protein ACYTEX_26010 [Planctomycetota bacterium]|jgi:hypothetical protein
MATLSRKTLGITISYIGQWSRATIDHFLYELDIPDRLAVGNTKTRLLLNIFQGLESEGREDLLRTIVFQALLRLQRDDQAWLKEALMKDGFVVDNGAVAEDVPIAEENRTSLELLVNRHDEDLDTRTLTHHLRENIDLFRQEKWDSSVSHARNFVEQLLKDIATTIASSNNENPDMDRAVEMRNYLEKTGFLDSGERRKLVDGVYGYFSEEGAHPGISDQSAARVCMHILWAFAYYILEKFEDWKQQND